MSDCFPLFFSFVYLLEFFQQTYRRATFETTSSGLLQAIFPCQLLTHLSTLDLLITYIPFHKCNLTDSNKKLFPTMEDYFQHRKHFINFIDLCLASWIQNSFIHIECQLVILYYYYYSRKLVIIILARLVSHEKTKKKNAIHSISS